MTTIAYVQVAPAGGGPNMECAQVTNGANQVLRQITCLGDPNTDANIQAVKGASTAAIAADPAGVVTMSPNSAALPVTGAFFQATQPISIAAALPAGANLLGKMGIDQTTPGLTNAINATPSTNATSALTPKILSAAGAATVIKAAAGNLWGMALLNNNAAVVWVEFFNTATPILGTTTPICAFPIPASASLIIPPDALALANFSADIYVAAVTAYNGTSTGSVSGTVFYA